MKKAFLSSLLMLSCAASFAQHSIFMQIIENKKICNKEDELTYFLQANAYERQNENQYYHYYAEGGQFYYTLIINDNECYVTYRTDNAKDYKKIKDAITSTCPKELAADKSVSYVCNTSRVRDVQIIFPGYSEKDKYYEILVFQNPEQNELPYYQANRIMPDAEKAVPAKKAKKRTYKKATTKTETAKPTSATPAAKVAVPTPTKAPAVAAPSVTKPTPKVTVPASGAPSVIKK